MINFFSIHYLGKKTVFIKPGVTLGLGGLILNPFSRHNPLKKQGPTYKNRPFSEIAPIWTVLESSKSTHFLTMGNITHSYSAHRNV
ncbi:protein of unknown function [Legionella hackeliae]|uniref:Uncharacterized protein n=1 Tax=Legionella hackeliae TaxID=449 RepID=A0A0A8UVZ1_LEGHA|nr:protein of unknown function [Legionella hackeliae]